MKDVLFRWLARIFVPAWAKEMEQEGLFDLRGADPNAVDESKYIVVEDNGADVTIFVFSGLDGLFGAGPRFEFRNLFGKLGCRYNLVFVRELRGYFYHLTPSGTLGGLEFYERRLNDAKKRLGASYNVAMGFSAGGTAAFYFGSRCGMDKIIGFCPSFPVAVYTSPGAILRHAANVKKLLTDFAAYLEVSVVSIWGNLATHRLHKAVGRDSAWDVMSTYRNCPSGRPMATVVFGAGCQQDRAQAQGLADLPEVKLRPVATGFHNVPGELKKRGELGPLLVEEIQELLATEESLPTAARVASGA
ncbi:MAG: hypothetical protein HZB26_13810 [Candidatus Hydrogenedentes bacterium]|nr:hypothetical protein [Candidatus Hydrogenedentota bacterium]